MYSGYDDNRSLHGVGFFVNNRIRRAIVEFEPVNPRLARLRLKGKFNKMTIISAYSPTEDSSDEDKNEFYLKLMELCERTSKHDTLFIVGDFNAKIGKEKYIEDVAGKHSIYDETSENGIRLCQLAAGSGLWIKSVSFPHRTIHKGTWKIPGSTHLHKLIR